MRSCAKLFVGVQTVAVAAGWCCYEGCGTAPSSCNQPGDYCASESTCGGCGGEWCGDAPPSPTPSPPTPSPPPPTPTPAPQGAYCPSANDFTSSDYGSEQIFDQGWKIPGDGWVASKAAYNLNGGSVEFDIDFSNVDHGVNANIFTQSPRFSGSEYQGKDHCDGADNDLPWCLEVDWIESNGHCGGATTLHTIPGPGASDHGCTSWGCRMEYHFSGVNKYHMKIQYGEDGSWRNFMNGHEVSSWDYQPSGIDWGVIKSSHETTGAVLYSSEWAGWVPGQDGGSSLTDCGSEIGDLDGSSFTVTNVVIVGTVVQGPEPTRCGAAEVSV